MKVADLTFFSVFLNTRACRLLDVICAASAEVCGSDERDVMKRKPHYSFLSVVGTNLFYDSQCLRFYIPRKAANLFSRFDLIRT